MEQVAGFYDPFAGKLYIADWLPLEMQRPALAHEIEHALQDQHFDLKKFATPIKDDGDRQLGHSALVEGDATAVMLEFQAQAMGLPTDQMGELIAQMGKQLLAGGIATRRSSTRRPRSCRETLMFPYLRALPSSSRCAARSRGQGRRHVQVAARIDRAGDAPRQVRRPRAPGEDHAGGAAVARRRARRCAATSSASSS